MDDDRNVTATFTAAVNENVTFVITSASCRLFRQTGPRDYEYDIVVSGTASGPVGARLVMPGLPGYIRQSWSSSWGNRTSDIVDRLANDPASTSWTATLLVAGAAPGTTKTVEGYTRTADNSQRITDRRVLTCQ
jgi:hypothetical protein